jgi:hypothetical protein
VISWHTYAIILPAVFFAGVVDSMAGGGGLISVPAYLAAGLPPHFVLGNNKFSSCFGTLFATMRYHQERMMDLPVAIVSAVCALLGSFLGARAVMLVDPGFLRYVLIVLVPAMTIFTFLKGDLGSQDRSDSVARSRKFLLAGPAALAIGFYDGFFGPGTGTFLILFYALALRYDLVTANANTKVVNLASNLAALVAFMAGGKVIFPIALPAAACGIAGNLIGARLVIKGGSRAIRPVFIGVMVLLFAKIAYDLVIGK